MLLWVFLKGFDFRCSCKVFKFSLTSVCYGQKKDFSFFGWLSPKCLPGAKSSYAAFVVFSDTVYKYDVMCHAQ